MPQPADNSDPSIQNTAPAGPPVHAPDPAQPAHAPADGPPGQDPGHGHAHADTGDDHEHTGDHAHEHGDAHDDHAHEHDDDADDHDHDHAHGGGPLAAVLGLFGLGHGHSHGSVQVDSALEGSSEGIRAIRTSLLILGATAAFQLVIAVISGSAGLLADTIHNAADALTALPLWVAFTLSRRPANRRFTYGYDRAEDVAGVLIVLIIFASALVAAWESAQKLLHPQALENVWWVMAAALVGFAGNEAVAAIRLRTGARIGSAALEADGQHARADGLTSLAVLVGALGSLFGLPILDPLVGLLITVAILVIGRGAGQEILYRLMDAVDPAVVDKVERVARRTPGVFAVHDVRVRWFGHRLIAELHADVTADLPTAASHEIGEQMRHALLHHVAGLSEVLVHIDPLGHSPEHYHQTTWHHRRPNAEPEVRNAE